MSRPLRIIYPGAWYHVMNRGLAHNLIFKDDNHRQCFLDLLSEIHFRYQVEIHAYCLMDNHYHLLLRTPFANLSRLMRHLDGVYTQYFNKSANHDGPLFRGRYKSILVEADAYLLQLSRYIHFNPVKAQLVEKSEQYPWSSYQAYLCGNSPSWLITNYILNYFRNNKIKKYKAFVEQGTDDEIDNFLKRATKIPILGSDKFIKSTAENHLTAQHKIADIPDHKILIHGNSIPIENIMQLVNAYYQINSQDFKFTKRRIGQHVRLVTMYLAHKIGQHTFSQIAFQFFKTSPSGVARAYQRFQNDISENVQLKVDIEKLEKIIMNMSHV